MNSTDRFIIDNYQIIKHGEILIRPGITLITGPSNNGKSSIFKAFKQLIYNLPGNTYINQFADKCTLTLLSDTYKIVYSKYKSKSCYDITENNETLHIDKLGVNQIEKVRDLTNINKDFHYNFWEQLEKPFLLNKTNREQFLLLQESPISSNLLNIQENIKSDIKVLREAILLNQGGLNTLNESIKNYEETLKYSNEINDLLNRINNLNNLNTQVTSLNEKYNLYTNIESELSKLPDSIEITTNDKLTEVYNQINSLTTTINNFSLTNNNINQVVTEINTIETDLNNLNTIMTTYFNICPLCGNILH